MGMQNIRGPFLPETTQRLVQLNGDTPRFPLEGRQSGLHLDKFTEVYRGDEKEKKDALLEVSKIGGCNELLKNLSARRNTVFETIGACQVKMRTAGPLTLHISRAGAWENAGICLHPVYGFAYLPGSGIKGLVRSWAETVWAQGQENRKDAWGRIDDIFGYSENSESHKFSSSDRKTSGWRPEGIYPKHTASAGRLVFHDAWPKEWPFLEVDITNNHHTEYYDWAGSRDGPGHGDWEDPVPVYFLCVRSGTSFEFAISDRKPCGDNAVSTASEWLVNALEYKGAGAKTVAGYGRFFAASSPKLNTSTALYSREYELELVSPAFLAGASQDQRDCYLRGATLRGLLRWWWRTMYADKINLGDLQMLETAFWGSVENGSPVSVAVRNTGDNKKPEKYTKNKAFLLKHGITRSSGRRNQMTMGLYYSTYGMAERGRERQYRPEKTRWHIVLTFRDTRTKHGMKITADEVERQVSAALWLLCRYGGIGAKSRKGFGSLGDIKVPGIQSREDCSKLAEDLVEKYGIPTARQKLYGPSLGTALFEEDISTEWQDPWFACHMIGEALNAAISSLDKPDRPALGMPRKGADQKRFPTRHASPVLWSLSRNSDGKLAVRLLAFPSPELPDAPESKRILRDFIGKAKTEINGRGRKLGPSIASRSKKSEPASDSNKPLANGDIVEAKILEEKTKKGKWKARHMESGRDGCIIDDAPDNLEPGQRVKLYVHAAHAGHQDIAFKWTAPKKSRSNKSHPKHHRGSGRQRR